MKELILAIETSCDETSVAVIKNGNEVLSLETATSIPLHQETRGVIPETAARAQLHYILPVYKEALKKANLEIEQINKIAVTQGPGLVGSLLIGVNFANSLAKIHNKKILPVHHTHGHIFSNLLERNPEELRFPILTLTVSGGHNELYFWKDLQTLEKVGESLDDAAGEAFDKCGRMIGLNYPAGASISALAEKGNPKAFDFPRALLNSGDFNFSFSGLKTAFLYKVEEIKKDYKKNPNPNRNSLSYDLAASLQEAICEILAKKTAKAAKKFGVKQVLLAGGVSANQRLRELVKKETGLEVLWPKKMHYCTDNAAMIGAAAYFQDLKEKDFVELRF